MKRKITLTLIIATLQVFPLLAAGKVYWTPNGVLISGINGMGIGDLLSDMRGGAYNITGDIDSVYIIRIDKDGSLPWGLYGRVVDNDNAGGWAMQMNPRAANDGLGGAIIVWDKFFPWGHQLYAQRMDSSGNKRWGSNAVKLTLSDSSQEKHVVVSDGQGGVVVAWQQYMNGQYDIYAQRLDSLGVRMWGDYGVAVCAAESTQQYPAIAKDDSGNTLICWWDTRNDAGDVYGQKISQGGATIWTNNGVAIADSVNYQAACGVVAGDNGRWIVSWSDGRSGNYDVYAQSMDRYGNELWTHQGELVCGAPNNQIVPKIVSDSCGGGIICWWDARDDNKYDVYVQAIDKDGTVKWINNGVPLCAVDSAQEEVKHALDGHGGAFVCWQDKRSGNTDIYAQHVDSAGNVLWDTNGMAVCNAVRSQERPHIVQADSGTAVIAWSDYRDNYARAYAQRVGDDPNGVAGLSTPLEVWEMELWQNRPNPFRQKTTIRYRMKKPGLVSLKVYNIAGELVSTLVNENKKTGNYEVTWEGRDEAGNKVGSGIYLCQLTMNGQRTIKKLTIIK